MENDRMKTITCCHPGPHSGLSVIDDEKVVIGNMRVRTDLGRGREVFIYETDKPGLYVKVLQQPDLEDRFDVL